MYVLYLNFCYIHPFVILTDRKKSIHNHFNLFIVVFVNYIKMCICSFLLQKTQIIVLNQIWNQISCHFFSKQKQTFKKLCQWIMYSLSVISLNIKYVLSLFKRDHDTICTTTISGLI